MAERWQQWYPHDIDAWQGSADIQALSDLAYRAIHNLLQDMWKQSDCSLPDDDRELAKRSRVAARWNECSREVRDYFSDRTEDGKLTHRVLLKKWNEAREVYEKRQNGAKKTNQARYGNNDDTQSSRTATRNADTRTRAGVNTTSTGTIQEQKQEQKTLALAVETAPAAGVFELPVVGGNEWQVLPKFYEDLVLTYPGISVMGELQKMRMWLIANPIRGKTLKGIPRAVNSWMERAQNSNRGGGNGARKQDNRTFSEIARSAEDQTGRDSEGSGHTGGWMAEHQARR